MSEWRLSVAAYGGPEAIAREDLGALQPGPGEVLVRHRAIGVNFIDTYHRTGLYPVPLPAGLGVEAAGVVEALGEGVQGLRIGERVAYVTRVPGSYATARTVPAGELISLPDSVTDDLAAAALLKGLTAEALIFRCARVDKGATALVHAAAGGVGQILVQWLHAVGVTVIAHCGSVEKAAIARSMGADHALHCGFDTLAEEVRALTNGRGADVSFDGVGAESWTASLDALARRGMMVTFGNASGPVPPFSPLELSRRGSLFVSRPTLFDYIVTPEERQVAADRLFTALSDGTVKITIGKRFALIDAADAHRALEARQTTGSTLLIP
ncbi:quinone oxidoreductase family protein [Sphingomonas montanisoli]|uniref:Quinone oxidoreductase n=1 Tax=Sphingomonas montanisoli TaxID=2606412 RepID=A0A5D9C4F5_9SPHN|nr:quinone oxidoreductase [Sphingomonas montanisoli]TZG26376.1 quinone oxidoreductase [Sphingomonas montanisoli]